MDQIPQHFDEETWQNLPALLANLPERIRLHIWGDPQATEEEREAERLAKILGDRFEKIDYRLLPRRINYHFYPVIGIMRLDGEEVVDEGVRFIGLPAGVQMTSLLAAIQNVSFRGRTSEALTRIQLHQLTTEVSLELITSPQDEAGVVMAQRICNMAVNSSRVRSYVINGDAFPDAITRYSVNFVPHLVVNERVHVEGLVDEETILRHMAAAI